MNKIRVRNYRAIEDSGEIEIKPITIAVGRNSAGKSSFVRIFPLLKQTLETRTADPILWYGNYVDFGDFAHTVSKQNKEDPIIIEFEIDIKEKPRIGRRYLYSNDFVAKIYLSVREKYLDKVEIVCLDQKIEMQIKPNGDTKIIINGDETLFDNRELTTVTISGDIIPTIYEYIKVDNHYRLSRGFTSDLIKKCMKYIYKKDDIHDIHHYSPYYYNDLDIEMGSKEEILSQLKKINRDRFEGKTLKHKIFNRYNNYIVAIKIPEIISRINQSISNDMKLTSYIKPIRAQVDRYYRVQGISIDQLDADGSNLPMILRNMDERELFRFESWCKETFNIVFSVHDTGGHISLVIKDDVGGEEMTNVADTGYGYSQMLPIVMLLYMIKDIKGKQFDLISKTVVIEQPELHLHPAFQARMMDVFVKIIKEANGKGIDLKFVLETHSETMINRLGNHVAFGNISKEMINILVFDKEDSKTVVSSKAYDDDGVLRGWPIDFFAPEDIY